MRVVRHSIPGTPFGIFGEVVSPHLLLPFEIERCVIGGDDLQVVRAKALPQLLLVPRRAQWRAHHVLRSSEVGLLQHLLGEQQVVGAGLSVDGQATFPGGRDRGERLRGRQVHHVDGDPGQLGERDRAGGRLGLR